jgi:hypothetical protein
LNKQASLKQPNKSVCTMKKNEKTKKVLTHLKHDISESKKSIREDKKLTKALKKKKKC